jgi:hypothetical protein
LRWDGSRCEGSFSFSFSFSLSLEAFREWRRPNIGMAADSEAQCAGTDTRQGRAWSDHVCKEGSARKLLHGGPQLRAGLSDVLHVARAWASAVYRRLALLGLVSSRLVG